MLELVSPAGVPEGVSAAVQNGADAVYAAFSVSDTAKPETGFSSGDFYRAAEFCRQRGVKIYAVIDYLPSDADFDTAVKTARAACRHGSDALIVNDLGLIRALRRAVPELPLFAGSKLAVHSLDGVKVAAAMGLKRVCLAKELTLDEIAEICADSPIETELTVHGSTCAACAGLCHLADTDGSGSSQSGICPAPCHLAATIGAKEPFPLKLRDTCLISRLGELEQAGVTAVRISGRDRRPEYTALTTDVYSRAVKGVNPPDENEVSFLQDIFSPGGFTEGALGTDGTLPAKSRAAIDVPSHFYSSVRKAYLNREYPHVPAYFRVEASMGKPIRIAAADDRGNIIEMTGPAPELAFHQKLTYSVVQTQLLKTGGTPFFCAGVKCELDKDIYLPVAEIDKLRDALLKELLIRRKAYPPRAEYELDAPLQLPNSREVPVLTVSVTSASQLSAELLEIAPPVVYIPLWEITAHQSDVTPFIMKDGISVCAVLPRVIRGTDTAAVTAALKEVKMLGVKSVLISNHAHILLARSLGFEMRGDIGLNVTSSHTLSVLGELGLKSAALPFEMNAAQAKAISKPISTEMIVYGRLPLMLTDICIAKNATGVCSCESFSGLADKDGLTMPVIKEYGCRNLLLSSRRLFLADGLYDYMTAGLWGVRLAFTTESAAECVLVAKRYLGKGSHTPSAIMENVIGG